MTDEETNSRVDKAERRKANTSCDFCPPNRKENAKRKPKTDVHKTKRKK